MSGESPPTGQAWRPWRRVLGGTCFGAAAATGVAAIAATVAVWAVRSSRDFTSSALTDTGMGAFAAVGGALQRQLKRHWSELMSRLLHRRTM